MVRLNTMMMLSTDSARFRFRENFSYEDMARRLSVSADGISSRLCEAALRLHAKLGIQLGDIAGYAESSESAGSVADAAHVNASPAGPVMAGNDCHAVERCVARFADETLNNADAPFVASHLEKCRACHEKVNRFRAVKSLLLTAFNRGDFSRAPSRHAALERNRNCMGPALPGSTLIGEAAAAPDNRPPLTPVLDDLERLVGPIEIEPEAAADELARLLASPEPQLPQPQSPLPPQQPQPLGSTGTLVPVPPPIVIEPINADSSSTVSITPLPESAGATKAPEVIGMSSTFTALPIESSQLAPVAEPVPIDSSAPAPVVAPIAPIAPIAPVQPVALAVNAEPPPAPAAASNAAPAPAVACATGAPASPSPMPMPMPMPMGMGMGVAGASVPSVAQIPNYAVPAVERAGEGRNEASAAPSSPSSADVAPSSAPSAEPATPTTPTTPTTLNADNADNPAAICAPAVVAEAAREPLSVRIRSRIGLLRRQLAAVPFWFVSCALHVLVIMLVALVSMTFELPKEEAVTITTELVQAPTARIEPPTRDESALADMKDKPVVDATAPNAPNPSDILDMSHADLSDHFETNNPDLPDAHAALGELESHVFRGDAAPDKPGGGGTDGPSLSDTIGVGGFGSRGTGGGFGGGKGTGIGTDSGSGGGAFGQRNVGGRKMLVERHGGSQATENAVAKALKWLASHQNANGTWGEPKAEPVVFCTSIATLAFLGAGHSERIGEYKDNVARAVAFLRKVPFDSRQMPSGVFNRNDGYSQAVLTMALSEAAAMGNQPETKAAAQRAVDYCVNVHQSGSGSERGGWRYSPKMAGDLSVSGWFIMALKSAKAAGLHVDPLAFEGARRFVESTRSQIDDSNADKAYGSAYSYSYMPVPGMAALPNVKLPPGMRRRILSGSDCCQAIGNLCLQFMGAKTDETRNSIEWYVRECGVPQTGHENMYYWYYGTLSTFQSGGPAWEKWNEAMQKTLLGSQVSNGETGGSWNPAGNYSETWGRAGQTALSALCLEVYYRYQRVSESKN